MKALWTPRRSFFPNALHVRQIFVLCAAICFVYFIFSRISNSKMMYTNHWTAVEMGSSLPRSQILEIIQTHYLIPPPPPGSAKPDYRRKIEEPKMMQMFTFISALLGDKTGGFFIEVGAWDGGELSNTLLLEYKLGWTGLLIEPHPVQFQMLKKRQRNAYLSNSCVGNHTYPEKVIIRRPSKIETQDLNFPSFEIVKNSQSENAGLKIDDEFQAQCFPLFDFIEALDKQAEVDYLSIDVDGAEFQILKNIPWNRVTIKAISVELNGLTKEKLTTYMETKHYSLVDFLVGPWMHDLLFVYRPILEMST